MSESGPTPGVEGREFQEIVADATDHARERAQAQATPAPVEEKKGKRNLLAILSAVLFLVAGWNVYYFVFSGTPTATFEATALQASIFLAHQAVEEEWLDTGVLPPSLEEVGADEEELTYSAQEETYILMAVGPRFEFTFRRGEDEAPFQLAYERLLSKEVVR